MNNTTKTVVALAIVILLFAVFAVTAFGATGVLPKGVTKFQDGNVTCYVYSKKSISCVTGAVTPPMPAAPKGTNLGA